QKLQDLRRIARGVFVGCFRPSDDLTTVVYPGCEPIIASQRWQGTYDARWLPEKTKTGVAAGRNEASRNATKNLSAWLDNGCVGNAHDQSPIILDALPGYGAVGPTHRTKLHHLALDPCRGLGCVRRRRGEAHRPTQVVDRIRPTRGSAERVRQSEYLIIGYMSALRRFL